MTVVPRVDIIALRAESRRQGLDPDKWNYAPAGNGSFLIRKGFLSVGELIFEDHAKLLVDALNAKDGK